MKNTLDETKEIRLLISQVKTLRQSIEDTLHNSSMQESQRYVSYKPTAEIFNALAARSHKVLKVPTDFYTFQTDKMGSYMDTLWGGAKTNNGTSVFMCGFIKSGS